MADILSDGNTRVAFVASIANQAAPTTTELNAGLLLQSIITADGFEGFEPSTSDVDNTALNSRFDTVTIGRTQFSGTMLRFKKQTGTDTVYNTLFYGVTGFIVARRYISETTAWTSGQGGGGTNGIVNVYPVIFGDRRDLKPEGNTLARWEIDTKISNQPSLTALIP